MIRALLLFLIFFTLPFALFWLVEKIKGRDGEKSAMADEKVFYRLAFTGVACALAGLIGSLTIWGP